MCQSLSYKKMLYKSVGPLRNSADPSQIGPITPFAEILFSIIFLLSQSRNFKLIQYLGLIRVRLSVHLWYNYGILEQFCLVIDLILNKI